MDNYSKLNVDLLIENPKNLKKFREIEKNIKIEEDNIFKIDCELIKVEKDRDEVNNKIFKLKNYKKNHNKFVRFLLAIHTFIFVGGLVCFYYIASFPLIYTLLFSLILQLIILVGTIPNYNYYIKNLKDSTYTKEELEDKLNILEENNKTLINEKSIKLANIESLKEEIQNLLNQEQKNISKDSVISQKIVDILTFDYELNNNFDEMKLKLKK